uniref:Uncharacterized protein n=1 Tax=Candidatus Kentrum sp. UNK TaxID=2126344 RepID=A0A451ARZ9_9GAMM|nr:MAG: hypothetical protein BECKUNK1418G_GA0071005_100852 [Candidatus Kentron sp. UNK]VFK68767.1 MAG: hypothetical protein BECKUNK1418H_GA0071006_10064 [Candidatus Kentron sp. UNK]
MSENAIVYNNTPFNEHIEKKASIVREKEFPFESLTPNTETIAAMEEARYDNLETVTLNELQAVLDADN